MARYELVERIGVGGMAEIFRGKAVAGGGFEKPVAIKRILPHLSQDKRFVELLITEANTLSQLHHRNIVQIYDVGLGDDGQYFLVMEFIDGTDLGAVYESMEERGERFPLDVALHIGAEVCEALEHAHKAKSSEGTSLGLVHRDVSPGNVLLSRSGEVKLTDFGIAKRVEEATGHGSIRGKFAYISPEQAENRHVDGRSDVFSLAILLFELITGQRMFSAMPDFDALRAVRDGRIPRVSEADPNLRPELDTIIGKALQMDPNRRYPNAAAFGIALRGLRYSLSSPGGDPGQQISGLLKRTNSSPSEDVMEISEHTVVRIATAAGFAVEFDFSDVDDADVAGDPFASARSVIDSFDDSEPNFDDAQTRALDVNDLSGRPVLEDAKTRALSLSRAADDQFDDDFGDEDDEDEATRQVALSDVAKKGKRKGRRAIEAALAEAADDDEATNVADFPPPDLSNEFQPTMPRAAAPARAKLTPPHRNRPPAGRAPTPTVRDLFYSGRMLEGPRRGATHLPQDTIMGFPRRKALIAISAVAVLLAIFAFVIVGGLLGDDALEAPSVSADAGATQQQDKPATEAAPAAAVAADAGPKKKRKKRRKKRRRKKKKKKR
jgi:serine/threonine protein kinase